MIELPSVEIWCDGGHRPHTTNGVWGAVLIGRGYRQEISGCSEAASSNEAEIIAATEALTALRKPSKVHLYTDSKMVADVLQGLRRADSSEAMWLKLFEASFIHKVTWIWIRGSHGNAENTRAHRLAQRAYKQCE